MLINFCQKKENKPFQEDIKKMYEMALNVINIDDNVLVNIVDVSPKKIREMNNKYRSVDKETDVLSFPLVADIKNIKNEKDYQCGFCNLGDIYINPKRVIQQAKEYGHSIKREYCFLALHGFLHLLGYDHILKKDEKVMFKLQDEILQKSNIGRD